MKLMLLIVALIAFGLNVRAEEPKPAVPAAAAVQADWPQIFRDLQEKDLVVREAAVKAFANALTEAAQASQKTYFENFKKSLAANDAKVREECVKQAVTVGLMFQNDKQRFPELLKDLTTGEPAQRAMREGQIFKAAEAVLQADHARGLIEKLGADDPQAQAQAVEALKAMKGDAAEELANGLDDEKASVKKLCAEMLRDLGPEGKEAVSALVFKLRDEDDKLGRKLASQALEQLGPAAAECIDELVSNLDDSDKILRRISANVLKKIGPAYKSATTDLVAYLTHDEKPVRNLASELLLALGAEAKEGVKDLIEIIDEPVAADVKPDAAGKALVPTPNDSDSKIRAANILASIGPDAKEALPGLKKFESSPEPELKEAVVGAMAKISAGK